MTAHALPASSTPGQHPPFRLLGLALVVVVAAFCVAAGVILFDSRQDTWNQAVTSERNLLDAMAQDIARNVELYDLSLQGVVDGLTQPALGTLSPAVQDLLLFDRAASAKDLGSILVLDRNGVVVRGSKPESLGADLSDREYFIAQKASPNVGLFISEPFRRRVTGHDLVIALSRRVNAPDGSFAGTVVGTMRLDYFRRLFDSVALGPKGSISLLRNDGTFLMRVPFDESQIGRNLSNSDNFQSFLRARSGTFSGVAALDGVARIYSFTHVGNLPLILNVALAEDTVFAAWRTKTLRIGCVLLLLCGVAAALGWRLSRQLRRTAQAERRLASSEAQYRLLADHSQDIIMRLDRSLLRTYVSPAIQPILGYRPEQLLGRSPKEIIHPEDWPAVLEIIAAALRNSTNTEATYRIRHKDGHYVWMEGRYSILAEDGGFLISLRDITKRKAAELQLEAANAELARIAGTDALTGLANRRRFDETLQVEILRAKRDGSPVSLLLLDVDRFKVYNDRYGHQKGDACLHDVAAAVGGSVKRPGDLTARYGGEEFVVLLPGTDEAGAVLVAERIRLAVQECGLPHEGNAGCGGVVTVSIGCATIRPGKNVPAADGPSLLADADERLYESKRTGRNRVTTTLPSTRGTPVLPGEEERLTALAAYVQAGVAGHSDSLDRIARMTAHLLGAPMAFVSLVGREQLVVVGRFGIEAETAPRETTFCTHTIAGAEPLVIPDTRTDPRFAGTPFVQAGLHFYAGAPLVSSEQGQNLGALCIADHRPRPPLDPVRRELLSDLARLVVDDLDRRRQITEQTRAPVLHPPVAA